MVLDFEIFMKSNQIFMKTSDKYQIDYQFVFVLLKFIHVCFHNEKYDDITK